MEGHFKLIELNAADIYLKVSEIQCSFQKLKWKCILSATKYILIFLKNEKKNRQTNRNGSKIWGNQPRKSGKHLTINIRKRIQNIRKSLNNSELLRDFLEFLKKNWNSSKVMLDLFPCWGVSISQFSIIVTWYRLRHITMTLHCQWLKFWSHDTDV